MTRLARFTISSAFLQQALALPVGTVVFNARPSLDGLGDLELVVEHESLPEVGEGQLIPLARPVLKSTEPMLTFPLVAIEWEWNVQPAKATA